MKLRVALQWRNLSILYVAGVSDSAQVIDDGAFREIALESHHWMGGSKNREIMIWVADVNAADCIRPIRDIRQDLKKFIESYPEARKDILWRVMFADEYEAMVDQVWWTMCVYTGAT